MELIIGGAYQGKRSYAKERFPGLMWVNGKTCAQAELYCCQGIDHFEEYLKRFGIRKEEALLVEELLRQNPDIVIICRELGYGIVPVKPELRSLRELTGRTLTMLASRARRVHRVVCGIGMVIKDDEDFID